MEKLLKIVKNKGEPNLFLRAKNFSNFCRKNIGLAFIARNFCFLNVFLNRRYVIDIVESLALLEYTWDATCHVTFSVLIRFIPVSLFSLFVNAKRAELFI